MILGLHRADAGELDVFGLDPSTAGPEVRALLGYSPEHHTLPPDVRAHDLVRHIAELHGLPHRDATNRASDALWAVGLGEERFRPIGTMSTGQRQRVKLAQAIAHDPRLVLLDEPTDGLDPVQRDQMLELIRRCGTEFGIDVLLSSHLLEEVERVCDSVVILRDGVVAANGSINELRGIGHGVTVDIDGDPQRLVDELARRGVPCRVDATHVLVDGEDDRTLDIDPRHARRSRPAARAALTTAAAIARGRVPRPRRGTRTWSRCGVRMSTGARIVDRSYRPYEGARGGVGASMLTVVKHSIQRSLGIKRTIWQKVLPVVDDRDRVHPGDRVHRAGGADPGRRRVPTACCRATPSTTGSSRPGS